jgi:PAS domain S-box-containing protein
VPLRLDGRIDRPWRFLAIGIVLVVVVLFYADFRAFEDATTQIDVTRQLLEGTDAVLSSVKDAETSERGYLITNDKTYLAPYNAAVKALPRQLDDLSRAAAAAHREESQVVRIRSLVAAKMTELKLTIAVEDRHDFTGPRAIVQTEEGRLTMDELRAACALLASGEYVSLFDRTRASELHANRSRLIVLVGCMGLVFLLFRLGTAVDKVVSERESFARNVEESRRLLQTTLASIGDAVIVTDEAGTIRFMNPVAEKLTGWTVEEARQRPLSEVFQVAGEHSRTPAENPFLIVRRGGTTRIGTAEDSVLLAREGGDIPGDIPIEDSAAPIRDPQGDILGVVLVFRDVTARRIAERELERWKRFFASAGFGMFVIDPKTGAIVDMNTTFAAMHGYSVEELRGKPVAMLAAPEARDEFVSDLRVASDQGRHTFEHQHLRRDGTEFPSLIDLTTFHQGRDEYWAGYCSDITERKQFEYALRESEERFRTLASALPQLIWSTDPAGRFEYVNRAWMAYTGWSPGPYPEDPWGKLLHPEDRADFLDRWNNSLESGNIFESQARLRRASDGGYRWFLCRGAAVRDRGGLIVRWLGGCTDVQQQVESATQLKLANEALQRSNADLAQFAYAASHDLQEPLRMVSIYSQLLREEFAGGLDSRAASYIDFAVGGAQRMSKLLKALLDYSRVDHESPAWSQRTDANAAFAAALLNLETMIRDTQADICAGPLPMVRVPEIHLTQLFQNLIGNALKYRKESYPPGETIRVRIEATPQGGGQWLFAVRDNGIGIEPEYLTQIFGVFKRLHGPNVDGTGIGLALCQRIVERAGGRIWAESQAGQGATFFFTLAEADRNG